MKKSEMPVLNPCPKCGGKAKAISLTGNYRAKHKIACTSCSYEQRHYYFGAVLAARDWNNE